jgi:hypothetical protein
VERWCSERRTERGEVLSVGTVWELSLLWYHDRLSPEYRGRSLAEIEEIFRKVGLQSPFWLVKP